MKIERRAGGATAAFTLLEVMIAFAIFFVSIFSILGLVSQSLRSARSIQKIPPNIGSLAAHVASTNQFEPGGESGDFGEVYPDHVWAREAYEVATNGFFQVDIQVQSTVRGRSSESVTSFYLYRPEAAGSGGGGLRGGGR